MRRTTSALTATILGAALAAPVVSAQQTLPSASDRPGDSAASAAHSMPAPGSTATPSTEAGPGTTTDPIVGMAATRGARYLLRNGIDYINYQEYERALKYLREAETRQKELSSTEKLTLKQAIERAQRGLREAVGSQTPYALSQRTRRPGGFSPAKPDKQLAAKSSIAPAQDRELFARIPNREGDDQGQPIRLTGGEVATPVASSPTAGITPTAAPTVSSEAPQPLPIAADQPDQLSGTNKRPRLTASTETNPTKQTKTAEPPAQPAPDWSLLASTPDSKPSLDAKPNLDSKPNLNSKPKVDAVTAEPVDPAGSSPSLITAADTKPMAENLKTEPLPTAVPVAAVASPVETQPQASVPPPEVKAVTPSLAGSEQLATPAPISLEQPSDPGARPAPVQPLPPAREPAQLALVQTAQPAQAAQPAPAPDPAATKTAATVDANASATATPPPNNSGATQPAPASPLSLEQPSDPGAKPAAAPDPSSKDPDTIPLPPLGNEAAKPQDSTSQPAQDVAPASVQPGPADPSPSATGTAPAPETTTDDLPPLPQQRARQPESKQDDARTEAKGASAAAQLAPPAGDATPPAVAVVPDELPPLPPGAAGHADPKANAEPLPQAAEELPALPPAVTGSQPQAPDSGAKPEAAVQPSPSQPVTPDPAAPQATRGASQPAVGTSQPDATGETRNAPATPAPSTGADTAVAVPVPPTVPASASATPAALPAPAPDEGRNSLPEAVAPPMTPMTARPRLRSTMGPFETIIPVRPNPPSTLRPDLQRQVEEMARLQEEEQNRKMAQPVATTQPPAPGPTENITDLRTQTQTQVDISRAPSPAEARPIRAIPVPEDWVPLGHREWSAQSKYWAAAATCHMPLYFQDPMLERYGHSVEQYFGPLGRYMAYPVDHHTQTTQRNQMVQPFFSVGLFAWQIITWPYALVVDPPWEAQYDLGYWRPGDKIPTDLYYQPLHGTGPPLVGRNY